jgi:hypothetical protein
MRGGGWRGKKIEMQEAQAFILGLRVNEGGHKDLIKEV